MTSVVRSPTREADWHPLPVRAPYVGAILGREEDLAAIERRLAADERLVTLVGCAGVGKTTLAAHVATRWLGTEGVAEAYYCDLSEAPDLDALCAVVARELGVPPARGTAELLGAAIAARVAPLVVLDNFEQLVAHARATVARWHAAAPGARFLVTSREPLRARGESVYALAPLGVPAPGADPATAPAYALMLRAAQRRQRDFAPTGAEARALVELVRRLEGIPLAIELAAARLSLLPPTALLERLARPLELLARAPARGEVPRETTMRGAIEWSWRLLAPHEQAALAQCSVFRGGFTVDAAEAVLDLSAHPGAPPALEALHALHDKSLLQATFDAAAAAAGSARLGCLLSVRAYAAEALDAAGGTAAARARHAAYFAQRASEWAARGERDALRREHENVLAAAEHVVDTAARDPAAVRRALELLEALDAAVGWFERGPQVGALLERLITAAARPGVAPEVRALADLLHAFGRWNRAPSDATTAALERAVARAHETGDVGCRLRALTVFAQAQIERGDAARARACAEDVLALDPEGRPTRFAAFATMVLGLVAHWEERFEDARVYCARACEMFRAAGDRMGEVMALRARGDVAADFGQTDEAVEALTLALRVARQDRWRDGEASSLVLLGLTHADAGRLEQAERTLRDAARLARERCRQLSARFCDYHLGVVLRCLGRDDEAAPLVEQAAEAFESWRYAPHAAVAHAARGALAARAGELERAARLFDAAEAHAARGGGEGVRACVALERAHLDWARAAASAAPDEADAWRRAVRARVATALVRGPDGRSVAARNKEVRLVYRALERTLGAEALGAPCTGAGAAPGGEPAEPPPPWVARRDATWFEFSDARRVDLSRRAPLRRVLRELLAARERAPGEAVPAGTLIESGWPGERIPRQVARNRLHVALNALRGFGLRELLVATRAGYLLDPRVPVRLIDAGDG